MKHDSSQGGPGHSHSWEPGLLLKEKRLQITMKREESGQELHIRKKENAKTEAFPQKGKGEERRLRD